MKYGQFICQFLIKKQANFFNLPVIRFDKYDLFNRRYIRGKNIFLVRRNYLQPKKLCIYDRVVGKILKTVDSVYQAISSREDCEDLCNNAPFRCHSYDFGDTGDSVCRLVITVS